MPGLGMPKSCDELPLRVGDTLMSACYSGPMPAKHTLHVALTEPLVRFVRDLVEAGHYPTASDVVRDGLRTLIERRGTDIAATGRRASNGSPRHG